MWNNTNPAELFSGTTWELITAGKYIQSGSTALQTGGNNSVSIAKANLPNVKLKVDSFNLTRGNMDITGDFTIGGYQGGYRIAVSSANGSFYSSNNSMSNRFGANDVSAPNVVNFKASRSWNGSTSEASPYTETLGSGTALSIQPAYITLKFWKRLS